MPYRTSAAPYEHMADAPALGGASQRRGKLLAPGSLSTLLCSLTAGVCFWALCVGLVIGNGWLRVGGLVGFFLLSVLLTVAERYWRRHPGSWADHIVEPGEHFDRIVFNWPPRDDERRVA